MSFLHRSWRWIALMSLFGVVGWVVAHEGHRALPSSGAEVDPESGQLVLGRQAREALDVQTALVTTRKMAFWVQAPVRLASPWGQHAFASSPLAGRIVVLHARPGQKVAAGEVVAEVASAELENLYRDLLTAGKDLQFSEAALRDLESAFEEGAGTEQGLREMRTRVQQDRNALTVARRKAAALGVPEEEIKTLLMSGKPVRQGLAIKAPITGTVVHADQLPGKVVEPLEHLFEIIDTSRLWGRIGVPEAYLGRITEGQEVRVRLTAFPGHNFSTRIWRVGNLDRRTNLVEVLVDLTEGDLRPGMTGLASLRIDEAEVTTIPTEALIRDGVHRYVFVEEATGEESSEFRRRNVVPGRQDDGWVEVRGGIYPGDRVVTRGAHELSSLFVQGVLKPGPEARQAIGLQVEPAGRQTIEEVLEVDGTVDFPVEHRGAASAPIAGIITRIHASPGQKVRAGDLLAEVASPDFLSQQIDLLRASLEEKLLDDTLRRLKAAGPTSIPRRKLREVENQLRSARLQQESLRRRLQLLGLAQGDLDNLEKHQRSRPALPIHAPLSGEIVSFDRILGQAVKTDEPLFVLHNRSRPLIQAHLSETEAARVRPGQTARVRWSDRPGFVGQGKIVREGRAVEGDGRTLSAWVDLDRPMPGLRFGQLVRLTVQLRKYPPGLAVSRSAVVRENTGTFVFVQQGDGRFERRQVRTGRSDDRFIEIQSGLQEGERVAVAGAEALAAAHAGIR
jgi:RND family efflux transporter MFP subunit